MKIAVYILAVLLLPSLYSESGANIMPDKQLVFEGTVIKIAPRVPASGVFAFYRLAKYRVDRICSGEYTGTEIVVDHLSLSTEELSGIKVSDRVCIKVVATKTILAKTYIDGIREKEEKVEMYYVGGKVAPPNGQPCECRG